MRIGKKRANTAKTKYVKHSYLMEESDQSRMVPKDDYMLTRVVHSIIKLNTLAITSGRKLATVNPGLP